MDIQKMVNRFLGWKLPKDFGPDAGISFSPANGCSHEGPYWPTGTNLLHAGQAKEMIEHIAADQPDDVWFPLLGTGLAMRRSLLNERQAKTNHGQTLDRLAERGGLSPDEAVAVLNRADWSHMKTVDALRALVEAGKTEALRI